jgi:hypothetical protein
VKVERDDVAVKIGYEVDGESRVKVQTVAGATGGDSVVVA